MKMYAILALALLAAPALADTITVGQTRHENVLVREGAQRFYVQDPATGAIWSVDKAEATAVFSAAEDRARLEAGWRQHRPVEKHTTPAEPIPASSEAEDLSATARLVLKGDPSWRAQPREVADVPVSDGYVPYIRLENVRLSEALDAMLRSLGLDYETRGNHIFISSPDRLRREAWDEIKTRIYQIADDTATLPKIVLRNSFGQVAGGALGGSIGGGGFGGGSGGFSGVGSTGSAFGTAGGVGANNSFGAQGFGGGGGFGGGRLGSDVTQISNISDMFSTIDDRLVGEAPAVIGGVGVRTGR